MNESMNESMNELTKTLIGMNRGSFSSWDNPNMIILMTCIKVSLVYGQYHHPMILDISMTFRSYRCVVTLYVVDKHVNVHTHTRARTCVHTRDVATSLVWRLSSSNSNY